MTKVNSGIKFEYSVRDYLQAKGYEVVRAAGSKGAVDLVAFDDVYGILIQAKKELRKSNYASDEERLRNTKCPPNFTKQMWIKTNRTITVVEIEGEGKTTIHTMSISEMNKVIKND